MLAIFKALNILGRELFERTRHHFRERAEIQNRVVLLLINRVSQIMHFSQIICPFTAILIKLELSLSLFYTQEEPSLR